MFISGEGRHYRLIRTFNPPAVSMLQGDSSVNVLTRIVLLVCFQRARWLVLLSPALGGIQLTGFR